MKTKPPKKHSTPAQKNTKKVKVQVLPSSSPLSLGVSSIISFLLRLCPPYLKNKTEEKKRLGFTLIEVMIAMAILAILATAGLMAYTGYLKKGRDTSRATVARQVNTEVMSYAASNGGQPPANGTQFRQFLQSASESLGSSATEVTNGTIIKDPLEGKNVCLDANKNATQPCAFHYTAYGDGTYAISYGIEDPSSMKTNFYKTTKSIPDATIPTNATEKYGVYIGTAPYIGSPVATTNASPAADPTTLVTTVFMSPRIDTVTVSGGGGGAGGGGVDCGATICGSSQQCSLGVCTNPCFGTTFCTGNQTCQNGACVAPTCDNGLTIGGYATVRAKDGKCWLATNLPGFYQWMRKTPVTSGSWPAAASWTGNSSDPDYGDPCPSGSHVPTDAEWNAVKFAEPIVNNAFAASSSLHLPITGQLLYSNGVLYDSSTHSFYWSSNPSGSNAHNMLINSASANINWGYRSNGWSVRCIQN